jgi:hypothetical protein
MPTISFCLRIASSSLLSAKSCGWHSPTHRFQNRIHKEGTAFRCANAIASDSRECKPLVCCYPDEAVQMPFIQDHSINGFCRPCLSVDTRGNTANDHAGTLDALKRLHYREREWQEKGGEGR